jgi:hypothetical protein
MREIHDLSFDIDRFLEDAARAKQELDAAGWGVVLGPRAGGLFAARTTKLQWSRALLKLVVHELQPDDLFSELIGNLDRIPRRRWPQVIALAVALRQSWREDGLVRIVRSLHVPTADSPVHSHRRRKPPTNRASRHTRKSRRAK